MRVALGVALLTAMFTPRALAQTPCAKAAAPTTTAFYIESAENGPRDSVVVARLCLSSRRQLGSYTAVLTYDTTRLRIANVRTTGGMQVSNAVVAGVIRLAGASPSGFANGVLASIAFRPLRGRGLGRVTVSIPEANTTSGSSLLREVRVTGWPTTNTPVARPVIDSIRPRSAEVSQARVTDVVLYGKGFAEAENTVTFGGAEVTGLVSERGGTIIRFLAPTEVPARGSSPSHRITEGRIEVRVRHAGGSSNAVIFTATGGS
jgi:hypothetical protein